jgi:hypothetical protein
VNRRPFSLGWVASIRAGDEFEDDRSRLLRGGRAWQWFRSEVDRVLRAVQPVEGTPTLTAQDEAVPPGELYQRIDDEAWRRLSGRAPECTTTPCL